LGANSIKFVNFLKNYQNFGIKDGILFYFEIEQNVKCCWTTLLVAETTKFSLVLLDTTDPIGW